MTAGEEMSRTFLTCLAGDRQVEKNQDYRQLSVQVLRSLTDLLDYATPVLSVLRLRWRYAQNRRGAKSKEA